VDIPVSTGQWISYLESVMASNINVPVCFLLPSCAHVHAFLITKEKSFADCPFTFKLNDVWSYNINPPHTLSTSLHHTTLIS